MNRDISIDILRFIALSGIILMHVGPGIFSRNCVVLMFL